MRQPIDHFVDGLAFSYQELSRFQDMICGLPKLCDLLTAVVDAHKIVAVIVPEQGIWGDGIDFPAVSMHALFGGGIIEVAEGDFPSLCNSGLDAVYADVDALVDSFYAAVDVQCLSSSTASTLLPSPTAWTATTRTAMNLPPSSTL